MSPVLLAAAVAFAGCENLGGSAQETREVTIEVGERPDSGGPGSDGSTGGGQQQRPQVPGDESCDDARLSPTSENLRRVEIAIRCLTNAARRDRGLDELRFDERLARAAATRSQDMADANFFGHHGPGNSDVRTAVRGTGWIPEGKSWLLGENIGWASGDGATPAHLMRSWLDSRRHRENILGRHYTQIGVGAVAAVPKQGAEPGATFTQVFGATGAAARRGQTG